jgi:uncharacterized protein (DUF4415 family)
LDDRFEWDEAKRWANIEKHDIDFLRMRALFDGRPIFTNVSQTPEEQRLLTSGQIEDVFYTVVWTWRKKRFASSRQGEHAMLKNERIVSYTASEIDEMLDRGEDRTDVDKVRALTEDELEASIDHDEEGVVDWSTTTVTIPRPKVAFTMRYDPEVLEWFRAQGAGYQTKINAVLRSYIEAQDERKAS